jgi:hypothetical protein
VNSPPPKPEVILTNFFAEPTVLLVPITSRVHAEIKITVNSMPNNYYKKKVLKQNLEINTQVTRCQNYPLYFSAH